MDGTSTWINQTLNGRYQIEDRLGHGGMATVYKAIDPNLNRVVAIKIIHPHLATDAEFLRRFKEEATAVAQLRHPNIVQVYDYNADSDNNYIVFEFVAGETLRERMARLQKNSRQFSIDETVKIAGEIGEALAYAHHRGMIHRDIKPANIMLDVHENAILTDFGIVKIMGGTQHTATGATSGTAHYMSPEQIQGGQIDARCDIYSLGVTLFEMVSGRRLYEAESAMTLMMMHISDPVPDIFELRPNTPARLAMIIEKMLAKEPERRYQSANEFLAALKELIGNSMPSNVDIPVAAPPSPPIHASQTLPPVTPPSKRPSTTIILGGIALLSLLLIAGLYFSGAFGNDTENEMMDTVVVTRASTETAVPTGSSVSITGVTIDSNQQYIVSYDTHGYTPDLSSDHIHFYFDTITEINAGPPGSGPWQIYGGPSPFTQYNVANKPPAATQICAIVANPDHSIQLGSGDCFPLP